MHRYIKWLLRYRLPVLALTLALTAVLIPQAKQLMIVIDPATMLPQSHPYVVATNRVAKLFGSRHVVIIGITPKQGDVFQYSVLNKVQRITSDLLKTPGVVRENVTSLSARKVKDISGRDDQLEVKAMMGSVPQTMSQMDELRQAVQRNPVYGNLIISKDKRTVAVIAEFRDSPDGFRGMIDKVMLIVDREGDASVDIAVGGLPVFLSRIEVYSERLAYLLPILILIIGLIHFEAFRTVQGFMLPLVTAMLATAWDLGLMGMAGIPFDFVTITIPIVVLAVAAGHAAQLLKRYYEEYYRIRETTSLSRSDANNAAVVESLASVGPVMLIAGTIAALSFFSLVVSNIATVRTLGVFTGIGILCALILEMTFIPALRSLLRPPGDEECHREHRERIWDHVTGAIARWVTGPRRHFVFWLVGVLMVFSLVGASQIVIDNSTKSFFSKDLPFEKDDRALNNALGGANTLYLLVDAPQDDAIKEPKVLQAMDAMQRFLEQQPGVGKTLSIVDFIKRMHQVMHNNDPAYYRVPESRELISQYMLLYSMSGEPSDFDAYVDYRYQSANIIAFLKNDSSAYMARLVEKIDRYALTQFGKDVRLMVGGSAPLNTAFSDVMIRTKMLNILLIGLVIFVVSAMVFRSIVGGIFVVIPLIVTVVANSGLMGWFGINLNIPTSICISMVIGIGADYTIYLIYRMREQILLGEDEVAAMHTVLGTAGKACLYVATAIVGGYSILLFSFGFYVHIWMGILIMSMMVVSVFTALTLIPALILTVRPKFIYGRERPGLSPASVPVSMLVMMIGLALAMPKSVWAVDLSATAIMEKNIAVIKVSDSVSEATISLINKSGQERLRKISSTTRLGLDGMDNMRMTRFQSPPDVKGTTTLLIEHSAQDDDIWIYLPALKKVRRLVSSNKKDSFMGTDFSYGDVIGYKVNEWEHRLLKEDVVEGKPCYVIESTPKSESVKIDSGYSKRVNWIRKDNMVTVRGEFQDEAGVAIKRVTFDDIRLVEPTRNKWQPMRMHAVNEQTGHSTVITIENFKANLGIKQNFFTTRNMEEGL